MRGKETRGGGGGLRTTLRSDNVYAQSTFSRIQNVALSPRDVLASFNRVVARKPRFRDFQMSRYPAEAGWGGGIQGAAQRSSCQGVVRRDRHRVGRGAGRRSRRREVAPLVLGTRGSKTPGRRKKAARGKLYATYLFPFPSISVMGFPLYGWGRWEG